MMEYNFYSTAEEVSEGLDLTGQNWVVTGCNSGLGEETIRVLALRGANIIGLARTKEKALKTFQRLGIEGTAVACELSALHSVQEAVKQIKSLGIPLQGIIANAGIMALPELQQKNGIELQFYTNHIGHFLLVTGLTEQLVEDGRAVIVSSGAHFYASEGLELDNLSGEENYDDWRMYGRSKLANILFARALNKRFAGTNRKANSLHPGVIRTNLGRYIPNRDEMYEEIQKSMTMKTVAQGTATQIYLATHPDLAGVGGQYFADCQPKTPMSIAEDDALAEELWTITSQIIARDLRG